MSVLMVCALVIAQTSEPRSVLERAQKAFGKPLKSDLDIFEVNQDYAVRIKFESKAIAAVHVFPKYLLNACDKNWEGPTRIKRFSPEEYVVLIEKVKELQDIGALLRVGELGPVTSMRADATDNFQNGFIVRTVVPVDGEGPSQGRIDAFSIYFLRTLVGTPETKSHFPPAGQYRIKLNGKSYLTSAEEYEKAAVGKRSSI